MKSPLLSLRHSLKTRVTLLSVAIFVIGIRSMTLYTSSVLRLDLERQLGAQQFSTVSLLAVDLEHEVGDRLRALETVAKTITPDILGNTTVLQRLLEERPIFSDLFNAGVFVVLPDGTATGSVPLSAGRRGLNFMEFDPIAAALKEGKTAAGKPVIGLALRVLVFSMVAPIRDAQGKVIGALAGVTDLSKPHFMSRFIGGHYGKTGDYVLVARQHRLLFISSDKNRLMELLPAAGISPVPDRFIQGGEGTAVFRNPVGVEVLASVKGIAAADWYLAAILPTEEAFAPAHDLNQRNRLSALILTVLAGALTWWLMRRQLAPLLATVQTLAAQTKSNQPMQPLPVARPDEIGDPIGGFNRLLASLGERDEALRLTRISIEAAAEGMYWMAADGRIIDVNEAACRTLGHGREAMLNAMIWELDARWNPENWSQHFAELRQRGSLKFEADQTQPDGRVIPVEIVVNYVRAGDEEFNCAFVRDITERKRGEEKLRVHERQYRELFELSSDALLVLVSATGQIVNFNEMAMQLYGYEREELLSRTSADLPAEPEETSRAIREAQTKPGQVIHIPLRLHCKKDGTVFPVEISAGSPIREGQSILLIACRDITERKLIEAALRERDEILSSILETTLDGYWRLDDEGNLLDVNQTYCQQSGYTREELLGMRITDLDVVESAAENEMHIRRTVESGGDQFETRHRRKDGSIWNVEVSATYRKLAGVRFVVFSA